MLRSPAGAKSGGVMSWVGRLLTRLADRFGARAGVPTTAEMRRRNWDWEYREASELDAELYDDEEWEDLGRALRLKRADAAAGFAAYLELAESGSAVAMNAVGEAYYWGRGFTWAIPWSRGGRRRGGWTRPAAQTAAVLGAETSTSQRHGATERAGSCRAAATLSDLSPMPKGALLSEAGLSAFEECRDTFAEVRCRGQRQEAGGLCFQLIVERRARRAPDQPLQ